MIQKAETLDDGDGSTTDLIRLLRLNSAGNFFGYDVFGRVVHGMEVVQAIRRGAPGNDGIVEDETAASRISHMRLGSEIPDAERPAVYVMDTGSKGFEDLLRSRRDRAQRFFHRKPPEVLDVCQVPMAGRTTR